MSVSARGKATSLFLLLLQVTTCECWESGDREGKRRNTLPFIVKAFRSGLGMKMGMAGVFKGSDITFPLNTSGAETTPKAPRTLPAAPTGFGSNLGPQHQLGAARCCPLGTAPFVPLSWGHPCSQTATAAAGAAIPPPPCR